jgi:hypothetical protein
MHRRHLRNHLIRAWRSTIKKYYAEQLINSERSLQVYFAQELSKQFTVSKMPRRVFIEPRIRKGAESPPCYPDIVICHTRRIIGIVELKYQPKMFKPSATKDFATLEWFANHPGDLTIANDRYVGPNEPKKYSLASDALLCWAGVYRGNKLAELPAIDAPVDRCLFLHAVTSPEADPKIHPLPAQ